MTVDAKRHPHWFDPSMPSREHCVLPCLLATRAAATPDRDFLLYEDGKRWTYGETYALARRAAAGLRRLGVRPGDKVLVWLPNGPDAVRAWFGINLVGACFAPLNIAYRGRLLEHAIEQSGATSHGRARRTRRAGCKEIAVTQLETLVVMGEQPDGFEWPGDGRRRRRAGSTPTTAHPMPRSSAGTRRC